MLHFCRVEPRLLSSHFSAVLCSSSSSLLLFPPVCSTRPPRSRAVKFIPVRAFSAPANFGVPVDGNGKDTFFANDAVSWSSLGISDTVSRSLCNAGFQRPSPIQAASIPSILSGRDTVVAAETGCGKTHSYLIPLVEKLCRSLDEPRDMGSEEEEHNTSLVICPNVLLCEQVVHMANCLRSDDDQPLLKAAAICGRQARLFKKPDVIVSTPVALLNYLYAVDLDRDDRSKFIRSVKYVVFDEADLLLCGSFEHQIIRLIDMLRFDEKLLSRSEKTSFFKRSDMDHSETSLLSSAEDDKEEQISGEQPSDEEIEDDQENTAKESHISGVDQKKGWRRVREYYERSKQYVFVAATLPENGKKTAGGVLKKKFPEAIWVSGNHLHRHNPRLELRWIEVSLDTQVDALIDAVNILPKPGKLGSDAEISRTMVFANTVNAVESVAKILQTAGIECFCYHRNTSLEECSKNLDDFREKGGLLVCTDAAARGIDIPNVTHVIQAEFATSAVDFLHRIGRTARAGQPGLVTSLYSESNYDLVDSVRDAVRLEKPLETAFSRKRAFRKKLKKRGLSRVRYASRVVDRAVA